MLAKFLETNCHVKGCQEGYYLIWNSSVNIETFSCKMCFSCNKKSTPLFLSEMPETDPALPPSLRGLLLVLLLSPPQERPGGGGGELWGGAELVPDLVPQTQPGGNSEAGGGDSTGGAGSESLQRPGGQPRAGSHLRPGPYDREGCL